MLTHSQADSETDFVSKTSDFNSRNDFDSGVNSDYDSGANCDSRGSIPIPESELTPELASELESFPELAPELMPSTETGRSEH